MIRHLLILVACLVLGGCYYVQAASGQWQVLRERRPIDDILADASTDPEVARRLRVVAEARQFASGQLALPDNDSYTSYADIGREFVVWNVFATPEFSLEPRTWRFPVAGCVSYRGYFAREAAEKAAARLAEKGFDVAIGGVPAYSTLGRFSDPVLNSMMRWNDTELVATLFHELAHQVLYLKGDTTFNESFASAVEEVGVARWLAARGDSAALANYRESRRQRRAQMALVDEARADLRLLYASGRPVEVQRREKAARLARLAGDSAELLRGAGREPTGWLQDTPNNAHLVPMSLYEGLLPAFRALLEDCEGDLTRFYKQAATIAALDDESRAARLDELAGGETPRP